MISDPRVVVFLAVPPGRDPFADVARVRTPEFARLVALQNVSFQSGLHAGVRE